MYLADLRYARKESAQEGSLAPGYVQTAREALKEMWRQLSMTCQQMSLNKLLRQQHIV